MTEKMDKQKPLEGVLVLDLTRVLAGPYCGMMLADMGATVIKIENPLGGDDSRHFGPPYIKGESTYFMAINRGKYSLALDLKKSEGKDIFLKLSEQADVVLENFRPGVMEKLGFGYEDLRKINPGIIYAAISGFGHSGPLKNFPGYDLVVQAMGGIMSISSYQENGPFTKVGVSEADIVAGMFAAFGIALALYQRQKTKIGQKIDVGMLDCQFAFLKPFVENYLNLKIVSRPVGNRHPLIAPFGVFKTRDSEIVICCGNQRLWEKLCQVLRCEYLIKDRLFIDNASRTRNHQALKDVLEEITGTRTTRQWLGLLTKAGIPCGTINTMKDVCRLKHIRQRNMIKKLYHRHIGIFKTSGIPVKMSAASDELSQPAPTLGEHSSFILKQYLKMSAKQIRELKEKKIIGGN